MKRILFVAAVAAFAATPVFAQDNATQQQLDQLRGKIQDLVEAQDAQSKKIDAIEKEISDLRDKVNTPAATPDVPSNADLKKLAEQLQEVDKKRQDDRELILKQLDKIAKVAGAQPVKIRSSSGTSTSTGSTGSGETTPPPDVPKTGYYYIVKDGDTISGIAKSYRDSEKHVKVTSSQILAANTGLDATKLYTGKKIFIPDANAK
jgi:LysM repeat protein